MRRSGLNNHLGDDVLVGVLEPLVEGDEAVAVLVHRLEVLATLGKTALENERKTMKRVDFENDVITDP